MSNHVGTAAAFGRCAVAPLVFDDTILIIIPLLLQDGWSIVAP